mgnify:FL=1
MENDCVAENNCDVENDCVAENNCDVENDCVAENNMHKDVIEIKEKYITYYNICDIFSDDAKEIYDCCISMKNNCELKYGKILFNTYYNQYTKDVPGFYSPKIPNMVRQFTYKGNDIWTLVKTASMYKEQALHCRNQESRNSTMRFYEKYKAAAIFKYGETAFHDTCHKIDSEKPTL